MADTIEKGADAVVNPHPLHVNPLPITPTLRLLKWSFKHGQVVRSEMPFGLLLLYQLSYFPRFGEKVGFEPTTRSS